MLFDIPTHKRKPSPDILRKRRVRQRTLYAIRRGILRRGRCAECGAAKVHAHHLRYDVPHAHLLISWLCARHHSREHRARKTVWVQPDMWEAA